MAVGHPQKWRCPHKFRQSESQRRKQRSVSKDDCSFTMRHGGLAVDVCGMNYARHRLVLVQNTILFRRVCYLPSITRWRLSLSCTGIGPDHTLYTPACHPILCSYLVICCSSLRRNIGFLSHRFIISIVGPSTDNCTRLSSHWPPCSFSLSPYFLNENSFHPVNNIRSFKFMHGVVP